MIPLNLVIGDRTYRVKMPPAEEEKVRKTLKIINDKITEFKTNVPGKDMQDYIAMTLAFVATTGNEQLVANEDQSNWVNELEKLENMITKKIEESL